MLDIHAIEFVFLEESVKNIITVPHFSDISRWVCHRRTQDCDYPGGTNKYGVGSRGPLKGPGGVQGLAPAGVKGAALEAIGFFCLSKAFEIVFFVWIVLKYQEIIVNEKQTNIK